MRTAVLFSGQGAQFPGMMRERTDAYPAAEPQEIKENLIRQLVRPVLFQQSVEFLLEEGFDTFVEIGPGKTLSNLVRRTAKAAKAGVKLYQFHTPQHAEELRLA